LHEGARVSSLIPAFFMVSQEINPEMGMSNNEAKSILLHIHQEFYRTTGYLEEVLKRFRATIPGNSMRLKPMATAKQQEEAVRDAEEIQKLFDDTKFWSKK
ncbi:MAG: hypothetical protein AB1468_06745, partial [Candidatus Micrarchaeota archaeon]